MHDAPVRLAGVGVGRALELMGGLAVGFGAGLGLGAALRGFRWYGGDGVRRLGLLPGLVLLVLLPVDAV